jgi:putative spermidine/putrescine transport system substrate-binding protein/spermidine/putrescine transport system substrate-binding protein
MSGAAAWSASGSDLVMFDWSGYEEPSFHQAYIDKHGTSPSFSFFGDEDEAFQKIKSGFKVDIAHPCSQSVVKWREAGLLQPLDTSRIKGWGDMLPGIRAMRDLVTTADGKAWFLPFDWGNTVLLYRTDKVTPEEASSLRIFADPKFEGRVTIGDNVDDAYALASLAIGLRDWTTMTDEQFRQASDFLRQVHKNVRLYWTDSTDINQALAGGEVDLAWGWNETYISARAEGVPLAMNRDTKEGISTWVCGYVLMKDAPGSLDEAYDFLSAVNDPKVSDYIVRTYGYGHGNGAGMAAIDPAVLAKGGYDDVETFIDKTLFQQPVAPALKQRMVEEFEKIKAGY